jgi:hypothetical protein
MSNRIIVPPFDGITLVDFRDRIELKPFSWCREFVALGRKNASVVGPQPGEEIYPFFNAVMGDKDVWVVTAWSRFENGEEEVNLVNYLDPDATEQKARKEFERVVRFYETSKEELEGLLECSKSTEGDILFVESRGANRDRSVPQTRSIDEHDLYQARLKVLGGMHPKTVALIHRADETVDPDKRGKIEREAVQSYFAEMAHQLAEDEVMEWQRNNPAGTEWLCHFGRVLAEPEKDIDPINHELALNWVRRKYNLLTAEELSDMILIATGQRVSPATLKKRRERLGLTTKRTPGPRPNSEQ